MKKIKTSQTGKKALAESIKVWELDHTRLVLAYGESWYKQHGEIKINLMQDNPEYLVQHGCKTCPLCVIYSSNKFSSTSDCKRCPIMKKTGVVYCIGSPYSEYENYKTKDFITINLEIIQLHLAMITWMKKLYKQLVVVL